MVESVGKKLHQARLQRGLTIDEAAHATKLRPDKIAALEGDDYSRFANNIYAKGFLQIYGRFLKVDVEEFARTLDNANPISISDYQYLSNAPATKTETIAIRREQRRPPSLAPLLFFIFVIGVGVAGWWLYQTYLRVNGEPTVKGEPSQEIVPSPPPTPNPDAAFITEPLPGAATPLPQSITPRPGPATPAAIPRIASATPAATTPPPLGGATPRTATPAPLAVANAHGPTPAPLTATTPRSVTPAPLGAVTPRVATPAPLAAVTPRVATPPPLIGANPHPATPAPLIGAPPPPKSPEQDFITPSPVATTDNGTRPGGMNEVLVATIKKTWVTVRKDDPKALPIFDDYVYPNANPLKLKGARFFIEARDPSAVQITKNGLPYAYQPSGVPVQ